MSSARQINSNPSLEDFEFVQRLERAHLQLQMEQVLTLLSDHLIGFFGEQPDYSKQVILLLIEVSGLAEVCENHHKLTDGGSTQLAATLNAFGACVIETIHFYGGDLLKFNGKVFLTCWSAGEDVGTALHNAISCSLYVRDSMVDFGADVGIQLKLKFAVSYGDVSFVIVGDSVKDYVLHGVAVDDIKFARSLIAWGELVVSPKAFRLLNVSGYQLSETTCGYAKILQSVSSPGSGLKGVTGVLDELCRNHLKSRTKTNWPKDLKQTTPDMEEFDRFRKKLAPRQTVTYALKKVRLDDLKPFIIKLLQDNLDDNPTAVIVNEMRSIVINYIDIIVEECNEKQFKVLIEGVYVVVQNFTEKYRGVIVWLSTFSKDIVVTVAFGLRSFKNENFCKNALLAAHSIFNQVSKVLGVKKVSIGVCYGSVYCGLVGHPQRKSFVVLGTAINKAVSFTNHFRNKIICDYPTYKNSNLKSRYFRITYSSTESTLEYNQSFDTAPTHSTSNVIGRDEEYDLMYAIVNHPEKFNYYGICFHGPKMIGKSKLIQWCFSDMMKDGYSIASVDLCQCTQRPYFCLSNLYKQLYDQRCSVESDDDAFVKQLPSELWDISEILQSDHCTNEDIIKGKFRIMSLFREMVRHSPYGFTVIFIDNVQHIDTHSLDILETIISEQCIRLICVGEFEKLYWDIRWRLSLNNHIKLLELRPLTEDSISRFVCNFLHVKAVHKNLISLLKNNCGGSPGVIEKFVYECSSKGYVEVIRTHVRLDTEEYIVCSSIQSAAMILVAQFREDYEMTDEVTNYVISMNIISQLQPFEFSTLTICVMLGEIFSRSSLTLLSNSPSEYTLLSAIKQLFYLGILECGYQCLMPMGFVTEKCTCYCPEGSLSKYNKLSKLPKIAFCKIFHFRDATIKQIVYNLINEEDKARLHRNVIEHIENGGNMCFGCTENNSLPIVEMQKFNETAKEVVSAEKLNIGDFVYSDNTQISKPKILDSAICCCLEILLQTYSDLIEHSNRINCVDRQIFYMIQHAFVVMLTREYEQAVSLLLKVLYTCKRNELNNYRKACVAKVNVLIGKAFLCLENTYLAKQYIRNALVYFISTIPDGKLNSKTIKSYGFDRNDVVECLHLVTTFFIKVNELKLAKISCDQCLYLIKKFKLSPVTLYDVSSTIISVYCCFGEKKKIRILTKRIHNELSKTKISSMHEMFLLTNLFKLIFQEIFLTAKLNDAIRLGYKVLNLTQVIYASIIQLEVLTTLAWALMSVKRIQDSVEIAGIMQEIGNNSNDTALLGYYTISIELILETSFMLEPYSSIHSFAMNYFQVRKRSTYTTFEQVFLLYLYNYHLRNNRWRDICVWKNYLTFTDFDPTSIQSTKNILKFTENLLVALARKEVTQSRGEDIKRAEKYLEVCEMAAKRFEVFLPRYYHMKSYFMRIVEKKGKGRKYLNTAFKIAVQHGNILEYCWLMQSRNSWDGGFSFEGDRKCIDWKLAKSYTPIHWSQILYSLPLYT